MKVNIERAAGDGGCGEASDTLAGGGASKLNLGIAGGSAAFGTVGALGNVGNMTGVGLCAAADGVKEKDEETGGVAGANTLEVGCVGFGKLNEALALSGGPARGVLARTAGAAWAPFEAGKTPALPFTMSTNDMPRLFAVMDAQRRVYGGSLLSGMY